MFSPVEITVVGGVVVVVLSVINHYLKQRTDSIEKISVDVTKVRTRIAGLASRKQRTIDSGLQEVFDLEKHLEDTKKRIAAKNVEHQKVINKADNMFKALTTVIDNTEEVKEIKK